MEADTKYNDTDLCWGPLRRVDAYRIYLVSGPAWPGRPGRPGAFEPPLPPDGTLSSGKEGLHSSTLWLITEDSVLGRKRIVLLRL